MREKQQIEAVKQMITFTRELEDAYKQGTGEYAMVSARGVLMHLGYKATDTLAILQFIAERGFWYCLDAMIPHRDDNECPDWRVCYWGMDQLRSRLECVDLCFREHDNWRGEE